jgi:phage terminase large subunit-like protein
MMAAKMLVAAELIHTRYEAFVRKCFATLHQGQLLGKQPYVEYLCSIISNVIAGHITRLIINLPPRHLKSFIGSVCLAAWWLGHRPSSHVLVVTYSQLLACELAHQINTIMCSPWYQQLFSTRISQNRFAVTNFSTTEGGGLYAVSMAGSLTGYGADLIIFDDPIKINDSNNEVLLQAINDDFDDLVMTRRNNPKTVPVVIVAHRLNENDLCGHLLEIGGWEHVCLPFIAPQDTMYGHWHRKKGEPLRPHDYDEYDIARIQASSRYFTLYQQCVALEEQRIKPEHFGKFAAYEVPNRIAAALSVDASLCSGPRNSFSVIQAWWCSGDYYYLLDQWRKQCDYEELWSAYKKFCDFYNPVVAIIERAANGRSLIRDSRRWRRNVRIVEIVTDHRSKIERLMPHIETIRAGRIRLPLDAIFAEDYFAEMTASKPVFFDQIDSTVQYLETIGKLLPLQPPLPRALGVAYNSRGRIMLDRNMATRVLVSNRPRRR